MRMLKMSLVCLALLGTILLTGCGGDKPGGEVKSDSTPAGAGTMAPNTQGASGGGAAPAGEKQTTKPSTE